MRFFPTFLGLLATLPLVVSCADAEELDFLDDDLEQRASYVDPYVVLQQSELTLTFTEYYEPLNLAASWVEISDEKILYAEVHPGPAQLAALQETGQFKLKIKPDSLFDIVGRGSNGYQDYVQLTSQTWIDHLLADDTQRLCGDRKISAVVPLASGGNRRIGFGTIDIPVIFPSTIFIGHIPCALGLAGACRGTQCVLPWISHPSGGVPDLELAGSCTPMTAFGLDFCSCENDGGW